MSGDAGHQDDARRALLRHLLDRDGDQRARISAGGPDPLLAEALENEHREVRALALQLASADPGAAGLDSLGPLLDDADTTVRARAFEVVGQLGGRTAVEALTSRLREEPEDDLIGVALRSLARAVAATPLDADVVARVRHVLSQLGDARLEQHRYVIATLDRLLDPSSGGAEKPRRPTPPADPPHRRGEQLRRPEATGPESDTGSRDEADAVLAEALRALSAPGAELDRVSRERVLELTAERIESWLRAMLDRGEPDDLAPVARLVVALPGVDLLDPLVDAATSLVAGPEREALVEVLATSPVAWERVRQLQASGRADQRLHGLRLALSLDPHHLTPIRAALEDNVATVRLAGTEAVPVPPPVELCELLVHLFVDDASPAVRLGAARPLGAAPPDVRVSAARRALSGSDRAIRAVAVGLLADAGFPAVSLLVAALRDESPDVVSVAAQVLARTQPLEAPSMLWEAVGKATPEGREAILDGIDLLDGSAVSSVVAQAIASDDPAERRAGLELATRHGSIAELAPLLHEALTDPAVDVRLQALGALGQHVDVADAEAVADRTRDPVPEVRLLALRLLRSLGDDRSFPHLLAAASDPDDEVRGLAREALLGRSGGALVAELVRALSDPLHRRTARDLLVGLGEGVVEPLLDHLEVVDGRGLEEIGSILDQLGTAPLLLARLADRQPDVRLRAVRALGAIGDTGVVPALTERLHDPVAAVRRAAIRLLGEMGDARAVAPLREALVSDPDLELVAEIERTIRLLVADEAPAADDVSPGGEADHDES